MKLARLTPEYLKFAHNKEEIDIPEYKFNESDVRGVWISNVENIDTPCGQSEDEYKNSLIVILDKMKEFNMNVAIFQVRPCNDAYYPSKLNPYSRYITGKEGTDPGFDVLAFFIEEAKKRGIRVHAWMNPYRVSVRSLDSMNMTKEAYLDTLAPNNYARLHKDDVLVDGANKLILAPSHQSVIDFVTASIMEVATKYDVEAVHIDDYFYPYGKIPYEEEEQDFINTRSSINESFDDWRRENVNKMIESIHLELKKLLNNNNKKVLFGISPFGIYRTNIAIREDGWENGSYNSKGALQCYSELYSDVYKWMKEGWIDYVVPQNYFSFERRDVAYHDVCWWWSKICYETNTTLYMGMALYHMGEAEGFGHETWQNLHEIRNQLAFNQNFANVKGVIFFTYRDLVSGKNKIKDQALLDIKELWK